MACSFTLNGREVPSRLALRPVFLDRPQLVSRGPLGPAILPTSADLSNPFGQKILNLTANGAGGYATNIPTPLCANGRNWEMSAVGGLSATNALMVVQFACLDDPALNQQIDYRQPVLSLTGTALGTYTPSFPPTPFWTVLDGGACTAANVCSDAPPFPDLQTIAYLYDDCGSAPIGCCNDGKTVDQPWNLTATIYATPFPSIPGLTQPGGGLSVAPTPVLMTYDASTGDWVARYQPPGIYPTFNGFPQCVTLRFRCDGAVPRLDYTMPAYGFGSLPVVFAESYCYCQPTFTFRGIVPNLSIAQPLTVKVTFKRDYALGQAYHEARHGGWSNGRPVYVVAYCADGGGPTSPSLQVEQSCTDPCEGFGIVQVPTAYGHVGVSISGDCNFDIALARTAYGGGPTCGNDGQGGTLGCYGGGLTSRPVTAFGVSWTATSSFNYSLFDPIPLLLPLRTPPKGQFKFSLTMRSSQYGGAYTVTIEFATVTVWDGQSIVEYPAWTGLPAVRNTVSYSVTCNSFSLVLRGVPYFRSVECNIGEMLQLDTSCFPEDCVYTGGSGSCNPQFLDELCHPVPPVVFAFCPPDPDPFAALKAGCVGGGGLTVGGGSATVLISPVV